MTKKIHFIIFVFMISCIKSQYIKVQYKFTYLTESNNLNSKKEELMTLVTNNKKSIYFSEDKLIGDSLKIQDSKTLTLPEIIANKNKYKTNSSSIVVIKDFDKNNLTFYNKIVKTYFTYTQKINSIDWTITQEIKKFENYILKKAIGNFGGREYTVWYCPEIQIPDGPYKFTGLPGLILEAYSKDNNFIFQCFSIKNLKNYDINRFNQINAIETTPEKYKIIENEYYSDPLAYAMRNTGVKIEFNNQNSKKTEKKYIPIEK